MFSEKLCIKTTKKQENPLKGTRHGWIPVLGRQHRCYETLISAWDAILQSYFRHGGITVWFCRDPLPIHFCDHWLCYLVSTEVSKPSCVCICSLIYLRQNHRRKPRKCGMWLHLHCSLRHIDVLQLVTFSCSLTTISISKINAWMKTSLVRSLFNKVKTVYFWLPFQRFLIEPCVMRARKEQHVNSTCCPGPRRGRCFQTLQFNHGPPIKQRSLLLFLYFSHSWFQQAREPGLTVAGISLA